MKLTTPQVDALDQARSHARQIEQHRKAINALQAANRLPIRPVFVPIFAGLQRDIENALFEHEIASSTVPVNRVAAEGVAA